MTSKHRYTDEQRADLVVMLHSEGYPDKKGALQKVSTYSKVPMATLHRWFHEKQNPPPSKLVNEKAFDLKEALRTELQAILAAMPDARSEASYSDLARAMGIVTDKIFLLEGKPTHNILLDIKAYKGFTPDDWDEPTATEEDTPDDS